MHLLCWPALIPTPFIIRPYQSKFCCSYVELLHLQFNKFMLICTQTIKFESNQPKLVSIRLSNICKVKLT